RDRLRRNAAAELRQSDLLALFLDGGDDDLLPPHDGDDGIFRVRHQHARLGLSVPRGAFPLECRHLNPPARAVRIGASLRVRLSRSVSPLSQTLCAVPHAVLGRTPPAAGGPCGNSAPAPREIISCSSSGFDERESAVCSEISFLKYSVANDWLKVCIPYLACPVCIIE